MKRLLLFGGAAEGRGLLAALQSRPVAVTISVATEYGRELLREAAEHGADILAGRMDAGEIAALLHSGGYGCVVDATHPYAAQATANIRTAAVQAGVPCLRLARDASALAGCVCVESPMAAAARLRETTGNALLTTGVKDLAAFTVLPHFTRRLYVRVLPSAESITACLALGYAQSHILAMQGPFSTGLNIAVMRQWNIAAVVSKDGGAAGGFAEKREAASALNAELIVIRRPETGAGLDMRALLREIDHWLEGTP